MENERKSWEQNIEQGEPDLWYGRFVKYLRLGTSRSVNAVYVKESKKKQEEGRTNTGPRWYEAAKEWKWNERARAWDLEEQERRKSEEESQRREDLKAIREMLLRHIGAVVEASSTSQIQAAKILHEYYIMTGDISQLRDELQVLQDRMRSLENGQ